MNTPHPSRKTALLTKHYPEARLSGFSRCNPLLIFYSQVNSLLRPDSNVLDVGCGRGAWLDSGVPFLRDLRNLKPRCAQVTGIDVDPAGEENPSLHRFHHLSDPEAAWDTFIQKGSIDLLLADAVLEHIEDPHAFFTQCATVLKPGGVACFRTFNRWHYNGVMARIVPNRLHTRILKFTQSHRKEEDVFPTYYRCNTRGSLKRKMTRAGLDSVTFTHEGPPAYLSFSPAAYAIGVMYQRVCLPPFRWNLFAFGTRPTGGAHP